MLWVEAYSRKVWEDFNDPTEGDIPVCCLCDHIPADPQDLLILGVQLYPESFSEQLDICKDQDACDFRQAVR